jgi:hypothetical protein
MEGHKDRHQEHRRQSEKNHARQKVENHSCQLERVNPVVDHPLRQVEHSGRQNNEQEDREACQESGPDFVEDVFVKGELQAINLCGSL